MFNDTGPQTDIMRGEGGRGADNFRSAAKMKELPGHAKVQFRCCAESKRRATIAVCTDNEYISYLFYCANYQELMLLHFSL